MFPRLEDGGVDHETLYGYVPESLFVLAVPLTAGIFLEGPVGAFLTAAAGSLIGLAGLYAAYVHVQFGSTPQGVGFAGFGLGAVPLAVGLAFDRLVLAWVAGLLVVAGVLSSASFQTWDRYREEGRFPVEDGVSLAGVVLILWTFLGGPSWSVYAGVGAILVGGAVYLWRR